MKIDLNSSTPDPIATSRSDSNTVASANRPHKAVEEDTASLSFDRTSVGSLISQAMAAPDVRQEKIDALRQAISNGQYKLEPDKIADAMLPERGTS